MIHATSRSPLLVLDTNVILDWIAFDDERVQPIVAAIACKTVQLVSNDACLQELRRALGYVQVKLDAHAQARAFARYRPHVTLLELPDAQAATDLPRCEDPDDQKFLDLAWHARASHLVTRDKALLKLARPLALLHRFVILAPDAFVGCLTGAGRALPPG